MSDFTHLVGSNIRTIRKAKGLTQEELAEKTGLQHTYVGGIERGERNVSLETLAKIINGLEVTPYELFRFTALNEERNYFNKKFQIDALTNLLIERNEKELDMILNLIQDLLTILDSKNSH